ncbi:phage tail tape measure protein [Melghirimyces algeriensis]|uniref:Phage tail tape measure protein, TP901 family, core region n=1 Tax=Melghirimyces algeriensis TaxID=910412 RepID=A0A521F9Y7_9BACL|nr:phage tail tape measure protein [Melghirimyces algeriensis]SMO93032.1 phage tail tape measure protein, TP901 family, core region [Melghirimyces algeriensis]
MPNAGEIRARMTLDTTQFNAKMAKAKNDMDRTSKSSKRLRGDLESVRTGFTAVGTAAAVGIGAAVYTAANFEQSMARVKAVSGATDAEFTQLTDTARELGATTSFSASQAAQGMQYLAMAGFETNEIISAMPHVLNLASAAQVDLGVASDIVSNIMTGFGLSAEESGRAVDVLTTTMTTANTDLNQLGDAMKYVAPVASGLGWSIEETAAAIAAMSDAGVQGSQAGTALRASLLSLASPTGQAEKAMKKYGIEVKDANGNMKTMPDLVSHIAKRLGGLTKAQKTAALSHLVGREAASGFIAMIEKGGPALAKHKKQLENSAGAAEEVAKTQRETLMGALKEMKSAFEELGIAVGNQFIPILKEVAGGLTGVARIMGELDPKLVAGATSFLGTAAAVGTLTSSLGLLVIGLRGLGPFFGPAGWLITGLSVVAGLYASNKIAQDKMTESTARQTAKLYDQNVATGEMIDRFDDLRSRTNLTNEEFGEFLDIQTKLKDKSNLSKTEVKVLSERMNALKSKSSLTKDEWNELVQLNDKLIERYPDHGSALTDLGNKYIANVDTLRKMNAEKRESLRMELWNKLEKGLDEYHKGQKRVVQAQKEYRQADKEIEELKERRKAQNKQIKELEDQITEAKEKGNLKGAEHLRQLKSIIEGKKRETDQEIEKQRKIREGAEKEIRGIQKKNDALRQAAQKYADILLMQNGINMEAGKNLENIYKRKFAIQEELAAYDMRREKGEQLTKQEREHYEAKRKELGVLDSILDQTGARKLIEKDVLDKLREEYDASKKTSDELNKKTKRKHDYKDAKDEKKTAKASTKELNTKTSRIHNYADGKKEKDTAKASTKELNTKTKRPHDIKEVQLALNTAEATTREANKKTKKPMDSSDIRQGHGKAKDLTREANKRTRKPLDYSSIISALNYAKSLHSWLSSPVRKVVSVARNIYERVFERHQGGMIPDPPKFHNGGIADFTHGMGGITPGLGGVDARLLGREMVLTQFQQARLFNAINSGAIGDGGLSRQDFEELADRIANRPVVVRANFNRTEFARLLAEPIKEEQVRLAQRNQRGKGRS